MMLPDTDLRYFPRRLVPFALEAGWQVHPEACPGDWAVLMQHTGVPVDVHEPRRLIAYAGAE